LEPLFGMEDVKLLALNIQYQVRGIVSASAGIKSTP